MVALFEREASDDFSRPSNNVHSMTDVSLLE
jgi:hypothetical protein